MTACVVAILQRPAVQLVDHAGDGAFPASRHGALQMNDHPPGFVHQTNPVLVAG